MGYLTTTVPIPDELSWCVKRNIVTVKAVGGNGDILRRLRIARIHIQASVAHIVGDRRIGVGVSRQRVFHLAKPRTEVEHLHHSSAESPQHTIRGLRDGNATHRRPVAQSDGNQERTTH